MCACPKYANKLTNCASIFKTCLSLEVSSELCTSWDSLWLTWSKASVIKQVSKQAISQSVSTLTYSHLLPLCIYIDKTKAKISINSSKMPLYVVSIILKPMLCCI